jgi:hypothetical protein
MSEWLLAPEFQLANGRGTAGRNSSHSTIETAAAIHP